MPTSKAQAIAALANKNFTVNQRLNILADHLLGIGSFNEYIALLTQASTGDPSADVEKNDIGTIAWARTGTGVYTGTLADAFVDDETIIEIDGVINSDSEAGVSAVRTSANVITLTTSVAGTPTDGLLTDKAISIRIPRQS